MKKSNILTQEQYDALPLKERIIMSAGNKLIKHFRGLEEAGMIKKDTATVMIGCVRKLQGIARGDEVESNGTKSP